MVNITKKEFDDFCEVEYEKAKAALIEEVKALLGENQASELPLNLGGVVGAVLNNAVGPCLDVSCRYHQKILSFLFFQDSNS